MNTEELQKRKKAGLTAWDVATAVGVSFQNVYNWEGGSYLPEAAKLKKLVKQRSGTLIPSF